MYIKAVIATMKEILILLVMITAVASATAAAATAIASVAAQLVHPSKTYFAGIKGSIEQGVISIAVVILCCLLN